MLLLLMLCWWGNSGPQSPNTLSPCPPCYRGKCLCSGVRLQVHRDVRLPPPQRSSPLWGDRQTDPAEERQQGGECTPHGQLQAEGEHWQEGQTIPGPHRCSQEQEDGFQAEVQVLPRPDSSLKKTVDRTFSPQNWPLKTRCCVNVLTLWRTGRDAHQYKYIYKYIFIFSRIQVEANMVDIIPVISW